MKINNLTFDIRPSKAKRSRKWGQIGNYVNEYE